MLTVCQEVSQVLKQRRARKSQVSCRVVSDNTLTPVDTGTGYPFRHHSEGRAGSSDRAWTFPPTKRDSARRDPLSFCPRRGKLPHPLLNTFTPDVPGITPQTSTHTCTQEARRAVLQGDGMKVLSTSHALSHPPQHKTVKSARTSPI